MNLTTGANVSRKLTFSRWMTPCATGWTLWPVTWRVWSFLRWQTKRISEDLGVRRHLAALDGVEDVVLVLKDVNLSRLPRHQRWSACHASLRGSR